MLPKLEIEITADPNAATAGFAKIEKSQKALEAATARYEASLANLARAEKQGLATKASIAKSIGQVEREYKQAAQAAAAYSGATVTATRTTGGMSGGVAGLGQTFSRNSFAISNAANQFSDLAVQIGAGVPATRALSQQLPQVTAMMGPLATIIGVASGVLIGLAGNFFAAGEEADEFADVLSRIQGEIDEASRVSDILKMSMQELRAEYGAAAESTRQFALAQAELLAAQASRRLAENIEMANDALRDFSRSSATMFRAGTTQSQAIVRIADAFGIASTEARQLEGAFYDLRNADGFDAQRDALERIVGLMDQYGVDLEGIPPDLAAAISEMITLTTETDRAREVMGQLAAAAANVVVALPMTTGTGISTDLRSSMLPGADTLAGADALFSASQSRGGGGGGGRENPLLAEFEALRESLMGQEELQLESYARQQEALQYALEQRLITQQEYNAMMAEAQRQHQEEMSAIDVYRYGTGLQQTEQFMGDMAAALQGGNDAMARAARTFGAIEALINAYRAFNQTLADPTLPWFAKIPAAASVLSAGMGVVNSIKSGSTSGSAGAGGAAMAGGGGMMQQPQQQPLEASISGLSAGRLIDGADMGRLLEKLMDEAGDRGLSLTALP